MIWLFAALLVIWGNVVSSALGASARLPGGSWPFVVAGLILVGISLAFQWRARDFLALGVALKEAGYDGHVTFGGHFATFASLEILRAMVRAGADALW